MTRKEFLGGIAMGAAALGVPRAEAGELAARPAAPAAGDFDVVVVDAANRHFPMPAGEGLAIVSLAAHVGLRESCHVDSLYRTKTDDIIYGRHFDDVIARGSYRVDIHEGAGITFKYLDGTFERSWSGGTRRRERAGEKPPRRRGEYGIIVAL